MKSNGLFSVIIALLWLVAMHHCAVEDLTSWIFGGKSAHVAASADTNGSPLQCPSHSQNDSSSHKEGQPCGSIIQASTKVEFRRVEPILLPLSVAFALFLRVDFLASNSLKAVPEADIKILDRPSVLLQLAHSLSLAPNAPPVTLA